MLPLDKLEQMSRRYVELDDLLCDPRVLADRNQLTKLNKERTDIEAIVQAFKRYREVEKKIREDEEALADPEIRGGEGGEEASLFAADLFRMYLRYAETKGWNIEVASLSESASGGYKEVIALVNGKDVYSQLRFEGGVHRVQRVPATETQGR